MCEYYVALVYNVTFDTIFTGQPIYSRGGSLTRRPLSELFEPLTTLPLSRITRDPWWWDYPHLRPYESPYNWLWPKTPFYLRDSYLSPIKRTYLWYRHPIRPFGERTGLLPEIVHVTVSSHMERRRLASVFS